jgi:hypothetical protein
LSENFYIIRVNAAVLVPGLLFFNYRGLVKSSKPAKGILVVKEDVGLRSTDFRVNCL